MCLVQGADARVDHRPGPAPRRTDPEADRSGGAPSLDPGRVGRPVFRIVSLVGEAEITSPHEHPIAMARMTTWSPAVPEATDRGNREVSANTLPDTARNPC